MKKLTNRELDEDMKIATEDLIEAASELLNDYRVPLELVQKHDAAAVAYQDAKDLIWYRQHRWSAIWKILTN